MIKTKEEYLTMWTVQSDRVLETLLRDGRYFVKKKYITEKYKDTAWIFQQAYSFFIRRAESIIERPKEAESPVWMFRDKRWAVPEPGSSCLKLKVPHSQVILFDRRVWNKILNLSFAGTEEEEKAFESELKRMGISSSSDVFEKPFYPLMKRKVTDSWESLFAGGCIEEKYCQGGTWLLKKEWVVDTENTAIW